MSSQLSLTNNPLASLLGKAIDGTPIVTRALVLVSAVALTPTMLPLEWANDGLTDAVAMCAAAVRSAPHPWVSLSQLVLSPLVHSDFVSGALSLFALLQIGTRIEAQRGSLATAYLYGLTLLLTQVGTLVLVSACLGSPWLVSLGRDWHLNLAAKSLVQDQLRIPIWGAHPRLLRGQPAYTWQSLLSFSIPTQACSVNAFGVVFAWCVYEAYAATRDRTRYVFMCPRPMPTRLVPWVLLVAFQFWFGLQLHTLVGFFVGLLLACLPCLLPPQWLLKAAEFEWMKHMATFVSVERAGRMQPWRHYVKEEGAGGAMPPGSLNAPASSTSTVVHSSHPNRTAMPVSRNPRAKSRDGLAGGAVSLASAAGSAGGGLAQSAAQWRRVDPPATDQRQPSSGSASSDSSGDEDVPSGAGASSSASGLMTRSPRRSPAASPRTLHALGDPSALTIAAADGLSASAAEDSARAAAFASNVSRILSPSAAYPLSPPSEADIQAQHARDDALQASQTRT